MRIRIFRKSIQLAFLAILLLGTGCSKYYVSRSKAQPQSTFGSEDIMKKYANAGSAQGSKKKKKKGAQAGTSNAYVEASKKARVKTDHEMKKPQYTDPMYFGHKKPPKKRKRGKRKLCKECGIVH